jgi:hypothetical protein
MKSVPNLTTLVAVFALSACAASQASTSNASSASSSIQAVSALVSKAVKAHGGIALENLKSYSEDFTINIASGGQTVANLRFRVMEDLAGRRVRVEQFEGSKRQQVIASNGVSSFTWDEKSGLKPSNAYLDSRLKPSDELNFTAPMKLGMPFLRRLSRLVHGNIDPKTVRVSLESNTTVRGAKGQGIVYESNTTSDGKQKFMLVIAQDGTLLAETNQQSGGTNNQSAGPGGPGGNGESKIDLKYLEYRVINGIKFPTSAELGLEGMPPGFSASLKVNSIEVNPKLDDALFTKL